MSQKLLGFDIFRVSDTPEHELGLIVEDIRGGQGNISIKEFIDGPTIVRRFSPDGRYKYVRAVGSAVSVNDAVFIDINQTDEPAAVQSAGLVNLPIEGIALATMSGGQFGWIQVGGRVPSCKVAGGTAAGAQLGSSATVGQLSTITISASPTQAEVQRVLAAASGRAITALDAESGGLTEVYIY